MADEVQARATKISIHALVKRATLLLCHAGLQKPYFNPRPREEGDVVVHQSGYDLFISIHALVKRATSKVLTL